MTPVQQRGALRRREATVEGRIRRRRARGNRHDNPVSRQSGHRHRRRLWSRTFPCFGARGARGEGRRQRSWPRRRPFRERPEGRGGDSRRRRDRDGRFRRRRRFRTGRGDGGARGKRLGPHRHSRQQRRRAARQDLRQNGNGGFRVRAARAPDRLGQLREGRMGGDARAQLWAHRAYLLGVRHIWQLRPGELWRCEGGDDRTDERSAPRGREDRHPRQRARADGPHGHDRRAALPGRRGTR